MPGEQLSVYNSSEYFHFTASVERSLERGLYRYSVKMRPSVESDQYILLMPKRARLYLAESSDKYYLGTVMQEPPTLWYPQIPGSIYPYHVSIPDNVFPVVHPEWDRGMIHKDGSTAPTNLSELVNSMEVLGWDISDVLLRRALKLS